MNPFDKFFNFIYSLFDPKVDWNKIDRTGIVYSDYKDTPDAGRNKGWVFGKDKVIICKHTFPVIGEKVHVFVNGQKIERTIISIDDSLQRHDIAICILDSPWPDGVKIYEIANKPLRKLQISCTFHQDKTFSLRRINIKDNVVFGSYYNRCIQYGDSGSPWFVWEDNDFKIVSHMYNGIWGEGPYYTKVLKK